MALGFVSTAYTGFLGCYSLWMHTMLSLYVVDGALDFLQDRLPCPLLRMEVVGEVFVFSQDKDLARWLPEQLIWCIHQKNTRPDDIIADNVPAGETK